MTEAAPATSTAAPSAALTVFIRGATLHSRGELLNGFFYAHRDALGIQNWYEAAQSAPSADTPPPTRPEEQSAGDADRDPAVAATSSPRLPAHIPVEVVYVRSSRKPYFLVEWRYPTPEEEERRKTAGEEGDNGDVIADAGDKTHSADRSVPAAYLEQVAQRTLALGTQANVAWRDQPVAISAALPGMTVAAERRKLELRDAQLKTQRVAEKREREEAATAAAQAAKGKSGGAAVAAASFVPRSVRRRT